MSDLDTDEIRKLEDTVELFREQIESLKQELRCECELIEVYRQELRYANSELLTACMLKTLGLDEAKEVAFSIVKSNKSVGESLAKLLSAIYNSPVKPSDLGCIERYREAKITTKSA